MDKEDHGLIYSPHLASERSDQEKLWKSLIAQYNQYAKKHPIFRLWREVTSR
jgi:hypothetical protein